MEAPLSFPPRRLSVAAYTGMCRATSDVRLSLATEARILPGTIEPAGRDVSMTDAKEFASELATLIKRYIDAGWRLVS